ncbi:hypothetical protein K435DRAFT_874805 [Dendrothele bispora CBS 962.96]|uniref:Uncharacterized protein n=1 Tax=Dendrothele bispora (strain CBS 962.96) TaxID=1314807 RepID=A0A4S8KW15_DENBC|nr:hypothetical protein K435DRAFT_874805 [Dendrothele bispora CBS 962.96]
MATQTTTETQTQQDPHPTPSPDPNHNSGFSTFTPDGYWRRQSHPRQHSESPPHSVFQGEGHTLRAATEPPSSPKDPNDERYLGSNTPNAPVIPTAYLPTPEPTRPRIRNRTFGQPEERNYRTLEEEVRATEGLGPRDPMISFRRPTSLPRSLQDEEQVQEMLVGPTSDPRSPQGFHTPIPPVERIPTNHSSPRSFRSSSEPHQGHERSFRSSSESPIGLLQPLAASERVNIPDNSPEPRGPVITFPPPRINEPRSYQTEYEDAMGSALNRSQPAVTTASSLPRRYSTPRDALEDIGEQCKRFGERLGVNGMESMGLEDHVRAV